MPLVAFRAGHHPWQALSVLFGPGECERGVADR